MTSTFEDRQQALLDEQVAPWVAKLPFTKDAPVLFDASEGYSGNGVMGAKAGPSENINFENVAHEMAHAIEIIECGRMGALKKFQWGLEIKSKIQIGHEVFYEPTTMQPTEREARVCGIQLRILKMVGHPAVKGFEKRHAEVLHSWMPDYCFGGADEKSRIDIRKRLIEDSHKQWPAARVCAAWIAASPHLQLANEASLGQRVGWAPAARRPR